MKAVTTVVIATTFIATAASVHTYSEFQQTLHHSGEIHVLSQEIHISQEDKNENCTSDLQYRSKCVSLSNILYMDNDILPERVSLSFE